MSRVALTKEQRKNLVENLRALRTSRYPGRGGSRKAANDFGVVPQQWSHWENGKRTPSNAYLKKIADFFGVTTDDLLRPGHFGPDDTAAEPARSQDPVEGFLEFVQLFNTLSGMQIEALAGKRNRNEFSAMIRDISRYAKFVMAEAEAREPRNCAPKTAAGDDATE